MYVDGKFIGYRDGVEFNQDKSNEISVLANTVGIKPNTSFGPLSSLMRTSDTSYGQAQPAELLIGLVGSTLLKV